MRLSPCQPEIGKNATSSSILLLFPSDFFEHMLHFVRDFGVSRFRVLCDVTIHLVYSNHELFHTKKVDEHRVLTGLTLDFTSLGVTLGNGGGKVTISRNHQTCNIGLRGTGDHILDEISVSRSINDSVVIGICEEFFGCARNGYTTVTFFLLPVHVEGERERFLVLNLGFFSQFFHLSLSDTLKFEDEATGGGRLAGIDVPA